jgi:hypothetical protein
MKILTDNRYIGTLERKLAVALNQNLVMEEDGKYLSMKKNMDSLVEELARSVRNFQHESIGENFA